jgi:hypothetical protein
MTAPQGLGSIQYMMSVSSNIHIYAVVTDGTTPNLNSITINVSGDQATAIVPGLVGPPGPAGAPEFLLDLQPDIFTSPADLPNDLTDDNFGEYWLIITYDDNGNAVSAAAYIWWNGSYRVVPFGTQGPLGPYPQITPQVILIDPDMSSYVQNTGTVANPSWVFYLAVPPGPQGPAATLAGCVDVNEAAPPTIGQVLGFNGAYNQGLPVYQPMTVGAMSPLPYTVPESAFSSFSGISGTNQTVCTFTVPANPWPWKPIIFGQINVFGLQLALNPLLVNVEVLLGDPNTGQLVGTGYGNGLGGVVTIVPQTSSGSSSNSSATNTAMTPQNSTALVPANQTAVLYVNLVNAGMAAVYDYTSENSQLFVLACPIGTEGAVNTAIYGSLSTKVTLSADSVVMG